MKDAYNDLDVEDLVELLKESRAKLRLFVTSKGIVDDGYFDIVNRLIKRINNTLPTVYLVKETRTIEYELEVEASSKEAALDAYRDGEYESREEVNDDSEYEVEER